MGPIHSHLIKYGKQAIQTAPLERICWSLAFIVFVKEGLPVLTESVRGVVHETMEHGYGIVIESDTVYIGPVAHV